ncbi:MAG: hypothetical protein K9K36_07165 [Desulfarculaceae bacterium]|nr:hypothetical protein [Desulfarculaceae bacterium]
MTELAVEVVKLAVLAAFALPVVLMAAGRRARRRLLSWAQANPGYAAQDSPWRDEEKEDR